MPRWASDVTMLRLNTGITVITVYRGKPTGQHLSSLLQASYLMFFVSIRPDLERQRENDANQTIRRTRVGISHCFHLSLLKFTLPNPHPPHIHNKINSAPDISNLFRTFNSLLCPPPSPPTTSITADDFATFFTGKSRTISSQF